MPHIVLFSATSWQLKNTLYNWLAYTFNMLNGLTTVRTAILRILQSKIEKGDPRHKKGTQRGPKSPKRSPRGPRDPKGDPLGNSGFANVQLNSGTGTQNFWHHFRQKVHNRSDLAVVTLIWLHLCTLLMCLMRELNWNFAKESSGLHFNRHFTIFWFDMIIVSRLKA